MMKKFLEQFLFLLIFSSKLATAASESYYGYSNNSYCRQAEDDEIDSKLYNCYGCTSLPLHLRDTEVRFLVLSHQNNTLDKLSSGILLEANLPNLQNLELDGCGIREIERGAFLGGNKISKLSLADNLLSALDPSVFADLPKLQSLELSDNPFLIFASNAEFPKLINLKTLSLYNCLLPSLPTNLFKNLENLSSLNLLNNQLTSLDGIALPTKSLNKIYLHRKCEPSYWSSSTYECYGYTSLPTHLNNLSEEVKSLQMGDGNNNLGKLINRELLWANLNKFESLYLDNCRIREIEKGAFLGGSNLTTLSLDHNQIEVLDPAIFLNLPNLQRLYLQHNPLHKFKEDSEFPKLNLITLSLHNCRLEAMASNLFENLESLQEIDLSSNKLSKLDWIKPLKSLKKINLSKNQIKILDPSVFADFQKLEDLSLKRNPLVKIEKNVEFPELENLTFLDLSNCQLGFIGSNLFRNLQNLQALDLSGNHFIKLDWKVFKPLGNFKEVLLHNNRWDCGCDLRSLLNFLDERKVMFASNSRSYPECVSANEEFISANYPLVGWKFPYINRNSLVCSPTILQLKVIISLEDSSLQENVASEDAIASNKKSAIFQCEFSGFPQPEVTWMKNGELLMNESDKLEPPALKSREDSLSDAQFSNDFQYELIINDLGAADEGDYECLVSNLAGNASKSFFLNVGTPKPEALALQNENLPLADEPCDEEIFFKGMVNDSCRLYPLKTLSDEMNDGERTIKADLLPSRKLNWTDLEILIKHACLLDNEHLFCK